MGLVNALWKWLPKQNISKSSSSQSCLCSICNFFFFYSPCLLRGYHCSSTAGLSFPPKKLKCWWCPRLCLVPCIYHVHISTQLPISGRFFSACQRPWSPRWLGRSCSCPRPLTCSGSLPGGGSHRWLCCRPSSVLLHCFSGGKGRVSSCSKPCVQWNITVTSKGSSAGLKVGWLCSRHLHLLCKSYSC